MLTEIVELDVSRRRGTFEVKTHTGTRYIVEANKRGSGFVRLISDGEVVKGLREGIIGEDGQGNFFGFVIRVGESLFLGRNANCQRIVATSPVVSIVKVEDDLVDRLVCSRCGSGYKEKEGACHLCRYTGN